MKTYDVIVIGGGQSGLAVGYYLRRTGLNCFILDREKEPSGAWQHTWESLRLFSPAQWSSLPGTIMPGGPDHYPTRDEVIDYLRKYESKYRIPVQRPVEVHRVESNNGTFRLETTEGYYQTRALVSATGSFRKPFVPDVPGLDRFGGTVIHSAQYRSPNRFTGQRVAVVGGGNSGAQILAEVSKVADTL